ncbi:hypothetical protein [Peptostreptococcus porci]|uniref:hypothetical protein n=1 Tax=Peptostreptococcus porci TaxID=2652282 RepID=UPI002A8181FA|nr:hypothetical protein [Peptostreptococcus porci]MDY4127609.1 hypothetical protein [Peptostreptococcus porci]
MDSYRYILKSTNESSKKYGVCEVCGKHVSEVYHQIEERKYTGGWTQHNCKNLFGHEECLKNIRK